MANVVRKGFIPVAADRLEPRPYTVVSAYAPSNSLPGLAVGEVVKLAATGTLEVADAGDTNILGVIASVKYKDTAGNTVTGGYLPTGYTFTGDATIMNKNAPLIMVWDQPNIEYLASLAGSASTLLAHQQGVGGSMDLSATSSTMVDTVFARSLRTLSGTYVAGAAQFKILELFRQPSLEYASTNMRVRCMINEGFHPLFNVPTGV